MSTTDSDPASTETPAASPQRYPGVDLTFAHDDPDAPSSVTIYSPSADDPTTTWLSADVEDAVALDAMR